MKKAEELTEAKTTEMPDSAEIMGIRVLVSDTADKYQIVVSPEVMARMLEWAKNAQKAQADKAAEDSKG